MGIKSWLPLTHPSPFSTSLITVHCNKMSYFSQNNLWLVVFYFSWISFKHWFLYIAVQYIISKKFSTIFFDKFDIMYVIYTTWIEKVSFLKCWYTKYFFTVLYKRRPINSNYLYKKFECKEIFLYCRSVKTFRSGCKCEGRFFFQ